MHRLIKLAAAAALTFATATPAWSHDYKVGSLEIEHPWARATPAGAKVAGGFLTITNTGSEPDRLIGGTFARSQRVEIHEMAMVDDVMKMRALAAGLELKPGETMVLKPGSYHVMFMELTEPLKEGDMVEGTLEFAKAGRVTVSFTVGAMGQKSMEHGASHGKTQ